MTQYIKVKAEKQDLIEVPSEEDGTLLLSTLAAQYPGVVGLKYLNPDTNAFRALKVKDGVITGPDEGWDGVEFVPVITAPTPSTGSSSGVNESGYSIEKSEKCSRLFIGNLPWSITEVDQLKTHFPDASDITLPKHADTGKIKGFGYMTFDSDDAAQKCLIEKDGEIIDGRKIHLDFAPFGGGPKSRRYQNSMMGGGFQGGGGNFFGNMMGGMGHRQHHGQSQACERLYVGNLPWSIGNQDGLKQYFPTATNVSVPVHMDSGKIKGYGYVTFASTEEATRVLNANKNMEIENRPIKLDFAPFGPSRSGGRGGGFGGGNRGGYGGGYGNNFQQGFNRGRGRGAGGFGGQFGNFSQQGFQQGFQQQSDGGFQMGSMGNLGNMGMANQSFNQQQFGQVNDQSQFVNQQQQQQQNQQSFASSGQFQAQPFYNQQ